MDVRPPSAPRHRTATARENAPPGSRPRRRDDCAGGHLYAIRGRAVDLAVTYDESAQEIEVRVLLDDERSDVPADTRKSQRPCPGPGRVDGRGRGGVSGPAAGQAGEPGRSRVRGSSECWVTKRQLAEHLEVTPRWIEYQQRLGLPRLRMGGMNRYRLSEVEAWLRDRHAAEDGEGR